MDALQRNKTYQALATQTILVSRIYYWFGFGRVEVQVKRT